MSYARVAKEFATDMKAAKKAVKELPQNIKKTIKGVERYY